MPITVNVLHWFVAPQIAAGWGDIPDGLDGRKQPFFLPLKSGYGNGFQERAFITTIFIRPTAPSSMATIERTTEITRTKAANTLECIFSRLKHGRVGKPTGGVRSGNFAVLIANDTIFFHKNCISLTPKTAKRTQLFLFRSSSVHHLIPLFHLLLSIDSKSPPAIMPFSKSSIIGSKYCEVRCFAGLSNSRRSFGVKRISEASPCFW